MSLTNSIAVSMNRLVGLAPGPYKAVTPAEQEL
jgi:hypothetical protein